MQLEYAGSKIMDQVESFYIRLVTLVLDDTVDLRVAPIQKKKTDRQVTVYLAWPLVVGLQVLRNELRTSYLVIP